MANKKILHHVWTKVRPLSQWYLLALAVIFSGIAVYALRQNNLTMIKLRDQVFAADQTNGDVEGALKNLREFIYSHMNTNLDSGTSVRPPIQLKYTYERLLAAQKTKTVDSTQIYTDAQHYCEKLYPNSFSGGPRVPCITNYVNTHTAAQQQPIPDSLYKFDFVSPTWTPDLAGWSLVLAAVFFILFAARYGLELWLKHELHDHM